MDKELVEIRRRKMMELLNKKDETIVVRIYDALIRDSGCGCGPKGCGPGGCGPSVTSPNMMELQDLASMVNQKYDNGRFRFELFNILDSSVQKVPDVYNLLKEGKGNALPIISVNNKIIFTGKVPSFEEFQKEIQDMM